MDEMFYIYIKCIWKNVKVKSTVFLLIFGLDDFCIDVSEMLKFTANILIMVLSPERRLILDPVFLEGGETEESLLGGPDVSKNWVWMRAY